MEKELKITKETLSDLLRIKDEFDLIVESLELAGNSKIMKSLKRSKDQIKKGELVDFNDL